MFISLPTEVFSSPLLNYGYDKLSVDALMKIFVAAQLDNWQSYEDMEEKLRANPEFCESINLPSMILCGNYIAKKAKHPVGDKRSRSLVKRRQNLKEA